MLSAAKHPRGPYRSPGDTRCFAVAQHDTLFTRPYSLSQSLFVRYLCELVAHFPEVGVEGIVEGTLKHLHGGTAGAGRAGADHTPRQLDVLVAENLENFVVVGEGLGKGEQERVAVGMGVDVDERNLLVCQHGAKIVPEQGRERYQGVEAGRIGAGAIAENQAEAMKIPGGHRFQHAHIILHQVLDFDNALHQPRGVEQIEALEQLANSTQFKGRFLPPQLKYLVDDLKLQFIVVASCSSGFWSESNSSVRRYFS